MVIIAPDKRPLPEDELPSDAPPSYNTLSSPTRPPSSTSYPRDEKRSNTSLSDNTTIPNRPSSSATVGSIPLRSKRAASAKTKGPSYWFNFGPSKTKKEVNSTILNLIRDLVKQTSSSAGASGILDSCAEACEGYDISFSSLLQQRSIEGHTPIYWAIIKRPSEPPNPEDYDLVTALLSRSTPLTPSTISDIRFACLTTSDQALFQRLRLSPMFSPMSGTDEMLLGGSISPDEIEVEDVDNNGGAFVARFKILKFQNRMRISKGVNLEFIARGEQVFWAYSCDSLNRYCYRSVMATIFLHSHLKQVVSRFIHLRTQPTYMGRLPPHHRRTSTNRLFNPIPITHRRASTIHSPKRKTD